MSGGTVRVRYASSSLRQRKGAFAGTFAALLCAAALVCACGMLMDTGLRSTAKPQRYAGAPVIVAGDPASHFLKDLDKDKRKTKPNTSRRWIPAALADVVRDVPGVERVVVERAAPVVLPDGERVDGYGWESAALLLDPSESDAAPAARDEVVTDRAPVGERVRLVTSAGAATYAVVGSAPGLYFAETEAERLADAAGRSGQVSAIAVWPESAASAVEKAVRRSESTSGSSRPTTVGPYEPVESAVVATGDERGAVEFPTAASARAKLVSMGGALGGTSLIVAILAVAGTLALAVRQRERELAVLRAVGATPRQLRRLVGRETLLVATAAAVPGALLGLLLGRFLYGRFVALGAVPETVPLVVGPFPVLAAVAATVSAAWVAAWFSSRRISGLRPVAALGEASDEKRSRGRLRAIVGLVFAAGGVVLALVLTKVSTDAAAGPLAPLTALMGAAAVTLLAPLIARVGLALMTLPMRPLRGSVGLAGMNLRAASGRTAGILGPLTLMGALAGTLLFAQTTLQGAAEQEVREGTVADRVIGPAVPDDAARALRETPGVAAVTEVLRTRVRAVNTPYTVQGVTTDGLSDTLDLTVTAGSLDDLVEDTVAASEGTGLAVGDDLSVAMADGYPVTLKVVALYERGLGFGELTMAHALVAQHVDDPLGVALVSAPGVPDTQLQQAVAPYGLTLGAAVDTPDTTNDSTVNYIALAAIVGFAAISLVNSVAMTVTGRSRDLELLRLAGGTRRQVLRTLRWETLAAVMLAIVLAFAIAATTVTAYAAGMTGTPTPYVPPALAVAVAGSIAVLALIATSLPARALLRPPPGR